MCRYYLVVPWLSKALGYEGMFYVAEPSCGGFDKPAVYVDVSGREYFFDGDLGEYVCDVEQCYADILTFWEPGPYLVDLLWSRDLLDVDKLYQLAGPRGRAVLAALVIWDGVLRGRSVSWGRFDPYREDFSGWLDYVAQWATAYILEDGARERFGI
ncbi:hypothetical protein Pogu_1273 [Pyrobaculum oguniense TE7]|uniref:Uncharacterized protein n=1 Tax=Pyrobaculum oguniense (strain DSM 13380 / JCM 10595 / TE7) TaxID=698757 RepID=H6QA99_PYROT|nr:hypothetical protein Pogu_1273 [Pyrobaculum oguniense TE7]